MDVITFGETMVLFSSHQTLPLEYVHNLSKQIAGAESNVAIGLARQGYSVGWFSKLGKDPFGRFVQNVVRGEGVDTSKCLFTEQALTGVFFKEKKSAGITNVYYYRKGSAASHICPEELDEDYIAQAKILHITGITPALSQTARDTVFEAIKIARKHNVKISFDPNIRFKLWEEDVAKQVLIEIASMSDYVLPSMDEGRILTSKETPEEIADVFHHYGAGAVVVKCGKLGAYFSDVKSSGFVPGFNVASVIDPVGAGDGFASGLLSGLLQGDSLKESVKRGNVVGAFVVQVNGDIEGLPTREEIEAFVSDDFDTIDVSR